MLGPFCGCGSAILAARKLGRQWIGIDNSRPAMALARRRMQSHLQDDDSFGLDLKDKRLSMEFGGDMKFRI